MLRRVTIKLLRQFAHGGIAAPLDVGEDFLDGVAHLGVRLGHLCGTLAALQMGAHSSTPQSSIMTARKPAG